MSDDLTVRPRNSLAQNVCARADKGIGFGNHHSPLTIFPASDIIPAIAISK